MIIDKTKLSAIEATGWFQEALELNRDEIIDRLKAALGVDSDADLAKELGVVHQSISQARSNRVPIRWIMAVAIKTGENVHFLLGPPPSNTLSLAEQRAEYKIDSSLPSRLQQIRIEIESAGPLTPEQMDTRLRIKKGTWAKMESGKASPSPSFAGALSQLLGISLEWLYDGVGEMFAGAPIVDQASAQGVLIPPWTPLDPGYFDQVPLAEQELSAGGGSFVISEEEGARHAFRKDWLKRHVTSTKNAILMTVRGDSMAPTIIDGDVVLIDKGRNSIHDGYIYALGVGQTIMIKRLFWLTNSRLQVRSDNPDFESSEVDPAELRVLGQVIWRAGLPRPTPPRR